MYQVEPATPEEIKRILAALPPLKAEETHLPYFYETHRVAQALSAPWESEASAPAA